MIKFLIRGVLKDKNRSLFPVLIVSIGVFLTVFLSCWLGGVMGDAIDLMAKFTTGHVKVMSKSYAENENQMPNDLALADVSELMKKLKADYPDMQWAERIRFGGLLDVPDENDETKNQGLAVGLAIDMLSDKSAEIERLNISGAIQRGKIPSKRNEALISESFAEKLKINPGDKITLFGSGKPYRQFMYADDLAKVFKFVIDNDILESFNVAPNFNFTIKEMAETALKVCGKENLKIEWDSDKPDGQFRKDISSEKLLGLYPNFEFTSLEDGMKKTYEKLNEVLND